MCVVSMVMDNQAYEWWRRYYQPPQPVWPTLPNVPTVIGPLLIPPNVPFPTQLEVDEFRRLLERAREYDKRNNEPDCETKEKQEKLRKMAEQLGVKIDFV